MDRGPRPRVPPYPLRGFTDASRLSPFARTLLALDLLQRFARHLDERQILDAAARVVVACSGGGDSTALLLLLDSSSKNRSPGLPLSVSLVACHVAHGLRGKAGEEDARFVEDLAGSLGIPFVLREVSVPEGRRKGESLEAAGRRLRYQALLCVAVRTGAGTLVATGHTLDDQAETVLLNLHRHSGRIRGGIRERRADGIVRPLLPFSRAELRDFLALRGVAWREDETNANERLLRNRIRRRELPALEAAWPGATVRLARAGHAWSRRLEALDRVVDAALAAAAAPLEGPWPRALVAALGPDGTSRLLVRAAGARGGVPGRAQLARVVSRLLGGETPVAEHLAGLGLSADARAVRLARRPRRA